MQPELSHRPDFVEEFLRGQLVERREKLDAQRVALESNPEIARLFAEVDAALHRLDHGDFGVCEECHQNIEADRLMADPLIRFCLCRLSEAEQAAHERDIELAASVQSNLLPDVQLADAAWEVDYKYEPAGAVSGDYIDLIPGKDSEMYFMLGDVSGKGVAASLLMSNLQAMFRALVRTGLPFCEIMQEANRLFCESTPSAQYATLVAGKAYRDGRVEFVNAGHLPPILVTGDSKTALECSGLPLGMFCSTDFAKTERRLAPGDTLLLYTDGLTEARNHAGEEYGAVRFLESINGAPNLNGHISECLNRLAAFSNGSNRHDDLTIMGLRYKG